MWPTVAGNIYVADQSNHTIRKITSGGVVTTLAGSPGVTGSADGIGSAARFSSLRCLTVDRAGNIYVGDSVTIRKITSGGVVTTMAGSVGIGGAVDGIGSAARFNPIFGVAVDNEGNVFVADGGNRTVRKITSSGMVTTFAGAPLITGTADGAGSTARFSRPNALTVDSTGGLFVADSGAIRRITSSGVVTTLAGLYGSIGSADGIGSAVRFSDEFALAVDGSGNLYVADGLNQTIRVGVPPGGTISPAPPDGSGAPASRLANLSVRTTLARSQTLIVGFTVSGGSKPILVRAAGPALGALGLTGFLPDPGLELYKDSALVKSNDDWASTLAPTFTSVGAFAFSAGSVDAAFLENLSGGYSAWARSVTATGTGTVLVEAYDAGTGSAVRLTNLSARNLVGTGNDILIAGFFVAGTGTQRVLIRAVGPSLAAFGLTGLLTDPKLEIYNAAGAKIAENDNWDATLSSTFASAGAFALTPGGKDAALIVTLPAGATYTVQVRGADGGTGEGLIEVYELP